MENTIVNNVIEELSKINDAAAGYAESMEDAKKRLEKDFRARREDYDMKLNDAAQGRLETLRSRLTDENQKKIDKLHADNEAYMAELDRAYDANHTQWAQEITEKIISERL